MSAKLLRRLLVVMAFVCLGTLALATLLEDRLIYWPQRDGRVSAPGVDVWLRAEDGVALHAWYSGRDPMALTVLYLHGTAGNLASRSDRLALFSSLGVNLLALDYDETFYTERSTAMQAMVKFLGSLEPRVITFSGSRLSITSCRLAGRQTLVGVMARGARSKEELHSGCCRGHHSKL